jgi:hypothetical protein
MTAATGFGCGAVYSTYQLPVPPIGALTNE